MFSELYAGGLFHYLNKTLELTPGQFYGLFAAGLFLSALVSYLLGSLNFAIIISRLFYHDDIRKYGSGNAGTTNMLRTYGKGAAIGTLLGDILKTVLAVIFGSLTLGFANGGGNIAGFFCMMGHVFPCFSRFRGGKGVASAAGVIILTNLNSPFGLLLIGALVFIFFTIVIGTKFVSLASVITMMIYPILQNMLNPLPFNVLMAALTALVIVVRHIDNLKRIHAGTESKISLKKTDKHKKGEPRDN